MLRYLTEDP
jgi:hypothetical protein